MPRTFRIKICGVTTPDDARAVAAAGAEAIGLNFFRRSKRYLDRAQAEGIVAALDASVAKVGLFVNSPLEQIADGVERFDLDWVQLHGDEPPELLADLPPCPVIRAFRVGGDGLAPVRHYLEACLRYGRSPEMLLVDAFCPGAYGGTGEQGDWAAAAELVAQTSQPVALAGGLTPANVAEAIAEVRPAAVDTASGVEISPGRKDVELLRRFVETARTAFSRLVPGRGAPGG